MKYKPLLITVLVPLAMIAMMMASRGVYIEVADAFPGKHETDMKPISGNTLSLHKQLDHQASLNIRDTMSFFITENSIHIKPAFVFSLMYPDITIPKEAIYGC